MFKKIQSDDQTKYDTFYSLKMLWRKTCWLITEEKGKRHYFLITDSMHLGVIILYIAEENSFAVIVYKLSKQKKR